jgi:hypothetical protein
MDVSEVITSLVDLNKIINTVCWVEDRISLIDDGNIFTIKKIKEKNDVVSFKIKIIRGKDNVNHSVLLKLDLNTKRFVYVSFG